MTPSNNSNWEFPVLIPKSPVKKALKNLVGKIAQLIKPEIRNELLNGKIPSNKIERAILCSIFIELKADNKYEKLAELHRQIWSSNHTQGYFDLTSGRLQGMFNLLKEPIYESITNLLSETDYQELIEIGCGEGMVVKNLSEKFIGIPHFVGIDINQAQIEINNSTYNTIENLRFVAGDITSNINLIKGSNKIFLSFGGVLEYLTEKELVILIEELSALQNIAFIIYEPIELGFNIRKQKHSIIYGSELSFCHPYHYYFTKFGFRIIREKSIESDGTNFIYLTATNS